MQQVRVPAPADRVPVASSAEELQRILAAIDSSTMVVLFLARRGSMSAWDSSITRVSMNLVDPHFAYVPIEISSDEIGTIYEIAKSSKNVVGMNHTTPHKNNVHLRTFLQLADGDSRTIDCAVRSGERFEPLELNGASFASWFLAEFGPALLQRSHVVIRGAGGAGSAIARHLVDEFADTRVTVIERDPDAVARIRRMLPQMSVTTSLDFVDSGVEPLILVDATGSSDSGSLQELERFLRAPLQPGIFIDLRTATHRPPTGVAASLGWNTRDGGGMSIANDWQLLNLCMKAAGSRPQMEFEEFRAMTQYVTDVLVGHADIE